MAGYTVWCTTWLNYESSMSPHLLYAVPDNIDDFIDVF